MQIPNGGARWSAVWILSARQWRSGWRSYRFVGVAVFLAVTWPFRPPAVGLEAIAAPFTLAAVAALLIGAAVIARDFDSGAMILDRLHGATPAELILGSLLFTTTAGLAVAATLSAQLLLASPELLSPPGWTMLLAGVLTLSAMCALLVLFGTVAPGYANSAIVIGLIIAVPGLGEIKRWGVPHVLAELLGLARTGLPLPHQLAAAAAALTRGESAAVPISVLATGTLLATTIAIAVVHRREPAGGWRR
ncbi:hypothetical protein BH23GEM2_BH23GEM2_08380 [soil metagenome]